MINVLFFNPIGASTIHQSYYFLFHLIVLPLLTLNVMSTLSEKKVFKKKIHLNVRDLFNVSYQITKYNSIFLSIAQVPTWKTI